MDLTADLYDTPGDRLDAFLEHSLQPQGDWKEEAQDAWQRVERFFRDRCFRDQLVLDQEIKVLKVVKGGSMGKGTTLDHSSDLDMVLFLSCFTSFQMQAQRRGFIIDFIEERLPVVLDPADPTNNLAKGRRWDLVAEEAAYCLQQACCLTEDPSRRWHVQRARDVQVTVKQTGKEDWTLSVDPYSPIRNMKAEIKIRNDIGGYQRLSFQELEGQRKLLSSQKTLAYYGIFSKVNIRVLETSLGEIQVFVKDSSGQSRPYAINPGDTILDLKELIEEAGGPCVEDQILKFQGRNLRNSHCLKDLEIKDCDTVLLFRRS